MTEAMVMPMSYVAIDEEEMTYLDGGYQVYINWSGVHLKLTGSETSQLLNDASWGAQIAGAAIAYFINTGAGVIYSVVVGTYGWLMSRMNRNNSGVTLNWSLRTWNPLPSVTDNW